eukprot:757416-Hanusia_phi.AAC.2
MSISDVRQRSGGQHETTGLAGCGVGNDLREHRMVDKALNFMMKTLCEYCSGGRKVFRGEEKLANRGKTIVRSVARLNIEFSQDGPWGNNDGGRGYLDDDQNAFTQPWHP